MRRIALGLVLLSGGCDGATPGAVAGEGQGRIACALGKGAPWHEDCLMERDLQGADSFVVLRHPDGGFRRFKIVGDMIVEADGAQQAATRPDHGLLEVTLGDDRYRIPMPKGPAHE